jgi:hypothetical protein
MASVPAECRLVRFPFVLPSDFEIRISDVGSFGGAAERLPAAPAVDGGAAERTGMPPTNEDILDALGDALRVREELAIPAVGFSMTRSLGGAEALVIRRAGGARIPWGGIAVYRRDGRWIAHRVIARRGSTLVTKGDSTPVADAPVEAGSVVGEVVAVLRGGRRQPVNRWWQRWPAAARSLLSRAGARPPLRAAPDGDPRTPPPPDRA